MSATTLDMPRRAKEKTVTTRVTEKVAEMIETICLAEGGNSSDVTSPILEKALHKRYLEAVEKINERAAAFKKSS